MSEKDASFLPLTVHEAYDRDVGRCVARINCSDMKLFDILDGDVIEISGKRRTAARCLSLDPSNEVTKFICIDGFIRNNIGAKLGDTVAVKKIQAIPAKKIIVVTLGSMLPITSDYLEEMLENNPVLKGDFVTVIYFGGKLTFQVIDTIPEADAVYVDEKTEFDILK